MLTEFTKADQSQWFASKNEVNVKQKSYYKQVRKNIGNGVMNVGCMVKYLESPAGRKRPTETLDAAFKKRFFSLSSNEVDSEIFSTKMGRYDKRLTLNRRTIRALEQRRDSLYKGRHGNGDNGKKNVKISSFCLVFEIILLGIPNIFFG